MCRRFYILMSQVPQSNNRFARYLFLVFLAQIGTPARVTYDDRKMVVPPDTKQGPLRVHRAFGETYLVRQDYQTGAVTVMFRLLTTKKIVARLTVNELCNITDMGIKYQLEELNQ
jgi:hypothetical protein